MSVEPQPREALENQTKSFLALFDSHLKIIADRYLAFFQKRRRIEEEYIASLRKLHREANAIDYSFDPRAEPTTTKDAWNQIRNSLEREASTREAFTRSLENTGDQTRKRLETNLRNSAADYADHAENTISKLQQAYLKKYPPGDHASTKKFNMFSKNKRELNRSESEESALEDECREAVRQLNVIRSRRAENLEDGYNCLEDLVFRTTVKCVLAKYLDDMVTASKAYHDLALGTRPGVWRAFDGSDESDLTGSFRRAFSLSIPPLTLYRNYRSGGNSNLVFGVPLVDPTANQHYVPKVIGMCIAEVKERGLNTHKIYSLRRRIESEETFSFSSSDNIYAVAMLLELYLLDLPEPLLRLSLRDFRQYGQNKAKYIENDFSLLRSVIRELPPVHRETLGELSRHLHLVASHSDKNGMTAKALGSQFCYAVFRGNTVVEGYVCLKACRILFLFFHLPYLFAQDSLMEELIQNAHTLFDEPFSPSPLPSAHVGSRFSNISYSSLFASTLFAEPDAIGSDGSASARSSSTIFPSVSSVELSTPPRLPNLLPSPLMGLPLLETPTDGRYPPEPEQFIPEVRGSSVVTTLPHTPPSLTSATKQQLSQQEPYLQARTIRHSPQNSLRTSSAYRPASSARSLQSRMRTFPPTL
ncbi:Rho GTPase activation protein [Lactarius vividus]|nr:Rho GTPase activation protein [Lactarius vividus]